MYLQCVLDTAEMQCSYHVFSEHVVMCCAWCDIVALLTFAVHLFHYGYLCQEVM